MDGKDGPGKRAGASRGHRLLTWPRADTVSWGITARSSHRNPWGEQSKQHLPGTSFAAALGCHAKWGSACSMRRLNVCWVATWVQGMGCALYRLLHIPAAGKKAQPDESKKGAAMLCKGAWLG